MVNEKYGDTFTILGEYKSSQEKILVRHNCPDCNYYEWETIPNNLLKGRGCTKCSGTMKKTHDEFVKEVFNLVGDEYSVESEYTLTTSKIDLYHKVCGHKYTTLPTYFLSGRRCPICKESVGERKIRYWLEEHNYIYQSEVKFEDLKDLYYLRFDFCVYNDKDFKDIRCLIEFDGRQHFEYESTFQSIKDYKTLLKHDRMKDEYCKLNNIELIRISYLEVDNIDNILNHKLNKAI